MVISVHMLCIDRKYYDQWRRQEIALAGTQVGHHNLWKGTMVWVPGWSFAREHDASSPLLGVPAMGNLRHARGRRTCWLVRNGVAPSGSRNGGPGVSPPENIWKYLLSKSCLLVIWAAEWIDDGLSAGTQPGRKGLQPGHSQGTRAQDPSGHPLAPPLFMIILAYIAC